MDPRKFLRMAALGMDEEIIKSDWPWMCTMCQRCIYVCPMKIDIPQLVLMPGPAAQGSAAQGHPGSCDMQLRNDSTSAMGRLRTILSLWCRMCWRSSRKRSPNFADMEAAH